MTINDLLKRIDDYAAVIRAYRPLSEAEVKELDAYYRIGMTYSSNALEGNSLTLSETKVLLEDGITVGGKPIGLLRDDWSRQSLRSYADDSQKRQPFDFRECHSASALPVLQWHRPGGGRGVPKRAGVHHRNCVCTTRCGGSP